MQIKTADLTDTALDWAVAKALGRLDASVVPNPRPGTWAVDIGLHDGVVFVFDKDRWDYVPFEPRLNWSQGGPLLDAHDIDVYRDETQGPDKFGAARGRMVKHPTRDVMVWCIARGPTKLIAGMRCLVVMRLGDVVDVPDELVPKPQADPQARVEDDGSSHCPRERGG